jgi:hypothetical protein
MWLTCRAKCKCCKCHVHDCKKLAGLSVSSRKRFCVVVQGRRI